MKIVSKRRPFLLGMFFGAALAITSAGVSILLSDKPEAQYLRVMDDSFDYILGSNSVREGGP